MQISKNEEKYELAVIVYENIMEAMPILLDN